MSYTPKGITPLPWEDGAKGYSITGPTTPVSSGVTVQEAIEHRKWAEEFDKGSAAGVSFLDLPKCPVKTSVPIVLGRKTVAISVGLTREESEAHSAYLVHAANEYPHAIDELRDIIALVKENSSPMMSNRLHDAIVKAERGVLARAKEREESDAR